MKVTASVLNVRSGPGTNFRVIGQLQRNENVDVLETHGDWASIKVDLGFVQCGWVSQAYLAPDAKTFGPPHINSVESVFGSPCEPACSAGRIQLPMPLKLGWSNGQVVRIACHVLMVPVFTAVFSEIYTSGLWNLLKTFDGIYNCRKIKGGASRSLHSWGIAIDLNAATNPQGMIGDMDPRIVAIFKRHGFYWGGDFGGTRRDDMHFEFVTR